MCDNDARSPVARHFGKPCTAADAPPPTGSRRQRLWDLPHECHCPVVGVCFPLDTLRQLVNKAAGSKTTFDDYEVHVGAVAQCERRTLMSELMQNELERRYAREIKDWKMARTAQAVAELWAAAVRKGDVAGAFWAALTHPRCDAVLREALCRDMHMLQHQAGATVRIDTARFHAVLDENAILSRELGKVQERSHRLLAQKIGEIGQLSLQLTQLRAESVAKDNQLAILKADTAALKASLPGFDAGMRLQKRVEQLTARQSELESQNHALRLRLATAAKSPDAAGTASPGLARAEARPPPEPHGAPVTLHLQQKTVLCVGGRSGSIANYRDLVERVGGRFAHHDGGLEDSHSVLDASLAAADLVICQTGCISHNAYWKVKDFCKRTGKRCVFVENPSASSLVRGLEQMSEQATAETPQENAAL